MEQSEIQRKDEEIVRQFRRKNKDLPENKDTGVGFVYIASSFVVLALLAMGITIVSNYDKMKQMEVSINRLEVTADTTVDTDYVEAMATTELPAATGNDAAASTDTTEGAAVDPAQSDNTVTTETSAEPAETESVTTETTLPVAAEQDQYYIGRSCIGLVVCKLHKGRATHTFCYSCTIEGGIATGSVSSESGNRIVYRCVRRR